VALHVRNRCFRDGIAEFATTIDAFPSPHSTAQIQRELTLWSGVIMGRRDFRPTRNLARTLRRALHLRPKRQTPNASCNPLARFGESIEGDGEDDDDADNDLLDVRRHVHQHETVQ
jgi:hypothetical protein